jgi:transposase-like protein
MAKKKSGKKRYTDKEKMEALQAVRLSNFNYYAVSMKLGIHRATLKKWAESKTGVDFVKKSKEAKFDQAVKEVHEKTLENHADLVDLYYTAQRLAVEQMISLLPGTTNVIALATAMKAIKETGFGASPNKEEEDIFTDLNKKLSNETN